MVWLSVFGDVRAFMYDWKHVRLYLCISALFLSSWPFSAESKSAVSPRQRLTRWGGGQSSKGAQSKHQTEDRAWSSHPLPRVLDNKGLHLSYPQPRWDTHTHTQQGFIDGCCNSTEIIDNNNNNNNDNNMSKKKFGIFNRVKIYDKVESN